MSSVLPPAEIFSCSGCQGYVAAFSGHTGDDTGIIGVAPLVIRQAGAGVKFQALEAPAIQQHQRPSTAGGVTALCVSSQFGHEEIVSMLLEKKAKPNIANFMGVAPVHVAALQGHTAIVRMLLRDGADPEAAVDMPQAAEDVPQVEKYTAYVLARLAGHQDTIALLETFRQAMPVPVSRVDTLSLDDKPGLPTAPATPPQALPLPTATPPSETEEVTAMPSSQPESQATGTIEPGQTSPPGALSETSSQVFPDHESRVTRKSLPWTWQKMNWYRGYSGSSIMMTYIPLKG